MQMIRKRLSQNGVTLIEVLLSITILSLILLTFLGLITQGFTFNAKNSDYLESVQFARKALVEVQEKESCPQDDQVAVMTEYLKEKNMNARLTVHKKKDNLSICNAYIEIIDTHDGQKLTEINGYIED